MEGMPPAYAAPSVRLDRVPWCTLTGRMVHGDRGRGARARSPLGLLGYDALAFTHGVAVDPYHVGIVHDPVADGVGQGGVVEVLMPSWDIKLGAEDRGRGLGA